jgi:hypothetical protein
MTRRADREPCERRCASGLPATRSIHGVSICADCERLTRAVQRDADLTSTPIRSEIMSTVPSQSLRCYGGPFDGRTLDMRPDEQEFAPREGGVYQRTTSQEAARMGLVKMDPDGVFASVVVDVLVWRQR